MFRLLSSVMYSLVVMSVVAMAPVQAVDEIDLPKGAARRLSIHRDLRSPGYLQALAYSPDGKYLAGITSSRQVLVWNAETGRRVAQFESRNYSGSQIFFTRDSSTLVTTGSEIDHWDTKEWKPTFEQHDTTEEKYARTFELKGHTIAAYLGQSEKIEVHDLKNKTELFQITRHRWSIQPIVSPDNKLVLVPTSDAANKDHGLEVWDVATKKKLYDCKGFKSTLRVMAISPDLKMVIAAEGRGALRRWSLTTGEEFDPVAFPNAATTYVTQIEFSRDGSELLVSTSGRIYMIDRKTGKTREHYLRLSRFAQSPDGKHLAYFSGHLASVVDLETGDVVLPRKSKSPIKPSLGTIDRIIASPGGEYVATSSMGRQVTIWDREGKAIGQLSRRLGDMRPIRDPTFSGDGKQLITHETYRTKIWDLPSLTLVKELPESGGELAGHALSPARKHVAMATTNGAIDLFHLKLGNGISSSIESTVLKNHKQLVTALEFSADNQFLASGSRDQTVVLWDLKDNSIKHELSGFKKPIVDICFSPDQKMLATAATVVEIWSTDSGEKLKTIPTLGTTCIAFSPDGKLLAVGQSGGNIALCDIETRAIHKALNEHKDKIRSLAFSTDGRKLGSASDDASAKIWDIDSSKCLYTMSMSRARMVDIQFSPDGKQFAAGDELMRTGIWDAETGEQTYTTARTSTMGLLAFDMDFEKKQVAILNARPGLMVTDLSNAPQLRSIAGYPEFRPGTSSMIRQLKMMPDGKTLGMMGSSKVQFWDLEKNKVIANVPISSATSSSTTDISPDARWIVKRNSSSSRNYEIWDVKKSKLHFELEASSSSPIYSIKFSPAEPIVIAGSRSLLRMWDLESGRELPGIKTSASSISRFEVSHDGTMIGVVSGSLVYVYELHSGTLCYTSPNLEMSPTSWTFSHDTTELIVGYTDGTAYSWSLDLKGLTSGPLGDAPADSEIELAWKCLSSEDGPTSLAAIWQLKRFGSHAVNFLAKNLAPAEKSKTNEAQVKKWIDAIVKGTPNESREASTQLRKAGSIAKPLLEAAIADDEVPALAKSRIRLLLAASKSSGGKETVRAIRAIRVLRLIGGKQAESILETMSKGDPESRETVMAVSALRILRPSDQVFKFDVATSDNIKVVKHDPVDLAKLPQSWKVDFKTKDLTVEEVVKKLTDRLQLKFEPSPFLRPKLQVKLGVELEGRTLIEALELGAAQVDMHVVLPQIEQQRSPVPVVPANKVTLAGGKPKWPIAYAGPFRVEVLDVRESAPFGTAVARISIRGYGLPKAMISSIGDLDARRGMPREFNGIVMSGYVPILISCKAEDGTELFDPEGGSSWLRSVVSATSYEQVINVPLKNLTRDRKVVPELQIRLRPDIPIETTDLLFDPLKKGEWGRAGGIAAMLEQVESRQAGTRQMNMLRFRWTGVDSRRVGVKVFGSDEKQTAAWQMSSYEISRPRPYYYFPVYGGNDSFAKAIISISDFETMQMAGKLTNIPLAKSAEQAESFPEIKFDGEPTSVKLAKDMVDGNRHNLTFEVTNQSNQPIREVLVQIIEDDGKGIKKDSVRRRETGPFDYQLGANPF